MESTDILTAKQSKIAIKIINKDKWLAYAKTFRDYYYTHYWEYSSFAAKRVGAISEHIAFIDKSGQVLAISDVRIKKIPILNTGIAYFSSPPMMVLNQNHLNGIKENILLAIYREYSLDRGFVVRIKERCKISKLYENDVAIYKKASFSIFKTTNKTFLIDLTRPIEKIRKNLHSKWRNILNKSEKQNILIREGFDDQLFFDFSTLFKDLVQKKKFIVNLDDDFYRKINDCSDTQEKFHMCIAYVDDQPISGHLSSLTGDTAVYILGATNELGRKLGAAYLMQWHVINIAKDKGCTWYDLGGIDKANNPDVYRFKERMGGEITENSNIYQNYYHFRSKTFLFLEKFHSYLKKHN